jgi:p-cumate 2,3-dioxygenase subunit alpha
MDLSDLVVEDAASGTFRVHRSTMTSPEIMELERKFIFERCWLYVGHESEVSKPGDYVRRVVAGRPLFMIHGRDGTVRIFINSCLHRGAMVCRADSGNAGSFVCFYHGWSYDNCGKLIGIPDPAGYAEGFCEAERRLAEPRHVDSYRGMYFVNFGSNVPTLVEFLGEAREIIDLTMDSAEILGGWKVIKGTARYDIRANWKLLLENSSDNYHFHTVHKTFTDHMANERKRAGLGRPKIDNINNSRGLAFRHGHVAMLTRAEGRTIASPSPLWKQETIDEVMRVRDELVQRYGEARGHSMADISRFLIIFPNLAFHDTQSGFKFRQWWPIAPDMMQVTQWELVPRAERRDIADHRLQGGVAFQGPGGFGTPDDIEALESCQIGYRAREVEWSDVSRGMRREARSDDELTARGFWREWHALVQGHSGAERVGDPSIPAADTSGAGDALLSRSNTERA